MDGLNLTRVQEVTEVTNPVNVMANKTFVVTLKEEQPYTMLKEEARLFESNILSFIMCYLSLYRLRNLRGMIDLKALPLT